MYEVIINTKACYEELRSHLAVVYFHSHEWRCCLCYWDIDTVPSKDTSLTLVTVVLNCLCGLPAAMGQAVDLITGFAIVSVSEHTVFARCFEF